MIAHPQRGIGRVGVALMVFNRRSGALMVRKPGRDGEAERRGGSAGARDQSELDHPDHHLVVDTGLAHRGLL